MGIYFQVMGLENLKNVLMNGADFLHNDSDAIIFGQTVNLTLHLWLLNAGGPLTVVLVQYESNIAKITFKWEKIYLEAD